CRKARRDTISSLKMELNARRRRDRSTRKHQRGGQPRPGLRIRRPRSRATRRVARRRSTDSRLGNRPLDSSCVAALVKQEFGINFTRRHCSRILRELGYRPVKPRETAAEKDPEEKQRWL